MNPPNDHDLLVILGGDMKHLLSRFAELKSNYEAYWRKADENKAIVDRHERYFDTIIGVGKKALLVLFTGLFGAGGITGLVFWLLNRGP